MNDYELLLPYFEKKYGVLAVDNADQLLAAIGKSRSDSRVGVEFYGDLKTLVMMGSHTVIKNQENDDDHEVANTKGIPARRMK